jgi:hypothetical protein
MTADLAATASHRTHISRATVIIIPSRPPVADLQARRGPGPKAMETLTVEGGARAERRHSRTPAFDRIPASGRVRRRGGAHSASAACARATANTVPATAGAIRNKALSHSMTCWLAAIPVAHQVRGGPSCSPPNLWRELALPAQGRAWVRWRPADRPRPAQVPARSAGLSGLAALSGLVHGGSGVAIRGSWAPTLGPSPRHLQGAAGLSGCTGRSMRAFAATPRQAELVEP